MQNWTKRNYNYNHLQFVKIHVLQHIDLDDPQSSRRLRWKWPCASARGHRRDLQRRWRISRSWGGVFRGHDEIYRIASELRATHPDFQYQPIAAPEELGNYGRVKWISGRLGEVPAYSGTDFLIARDGRIADVIMFFDKPPELNSAVWYPNEGRGGPKTLRRISSDSLQTTYIHWFHKLNR